MIWPYHSSCHLHHRRVCVARNHQDSPVTLSKVTLWSECRSIEYRQTSRMFLAISLATDAIKHPIFTI